VRAALLLAALLVLLRLAGAAPLETFYQTADGADYAPAFERAQLACAQRGGARPPLAGLPGCRIELDARAYFVSRPIAVCIPLQVVGQGIGYTLNSSRVETARTTAFQALRGVCPWNTAMGAQGILSLEHVTLLNVVSAHVEGSAPFFGVDADAPIMLTDVGIRDFVRGINLDCDKGVGTNCNASILAAVYVQGSESDGVYTRGGDSNAGTFTALNVAGACRFEARWRYLKTCPAGSIAPTCTQDRLRCAGIFEASFLGNTIVGGHLASENGAAGIVLSGASNHSALIGTYAETDTGAQYGDAKTTVVGGHNGFSGPLGQLHGMASTGLVVSNGDTKLLLGGATNNPNGTMTISHPVMGPWPFTWKVNPTTGTWYVDRGNLAPVLGAIQWVAP